MLAPATMMLHPQFYNAIFGTAPILPIQVFYVYSVQMPVKHNVSLTFSLASHSPRINLHAAASVSISESSSTMNSGAIVTWCTLCCASARGICFSVSDKTTRSRAVARTSMDPTRSLSVSGDRLFRSISIGKGGIDRHTTR